MKSFRKALAVLLSVLMVVFSFPLSALALPNPNQTPDGKYADDYDVVVHTYIMDYDGQDAYAYYSYEYLDNGNLNFHDPHNIQRDKLSSPDGTFCIVFTVTGLDQAENGYSFIIDYQGEPGDLITPASYGRRDALSTGVDVSADAVLETIKTYHNDADDTGCEAAKLVAGQYFLYNTAINTTAFDEQTQMDAENPDSIFEGQILGVFGYQMVDGVDNLDITDALKVRARDSSTYFMEIYDKDVNIMNNHQIVAYNSIDHATEEISKKTMFTMPEWGLAPEETGPEEVTYTYTFADQHTEQVTAAAGEAPVAPANTATTDWESVGDGNHKRTSYSWPEWQDGVTEYTEVATPETAACEMVEKEAQVDPTHTTPGKTAVMECSVCGYTTGGEEIPADADAHSYTEVERVESTCKTQGHVKYECECGDTYTETLELDPSNHENVVTLEAVEATCTTTGLTEGSKCEACGTTIVEQEVIEALGHDYQVTSSTDATCCVEGTVTSTCTRCKDTKVETGVLDPTNHADYGTKVEHAKEATRGEDGYTGDTVCNGCGATITKGEVIPALGVQITVTANELGSTTINGEATTGAAQKVAYAKDYTLAATANEGAEFVGWSVAGKIVSTSATYTTTAYADTTYVPVFAEAEAEAFTVTFVDQFNKVVDTIDSTELASLEALPDAPAYMGYTFDSWSLTLDEVKALEEATVVTASYTKNDLSYTVSAPNCTITVDGQAYEDTATVGFDSKVTVAPKADTATSWTVNGATAAYGESYTFYVTADVNVAYGTDSVTAAPTVSNVSAELVSADSHQVRFLATRSVPEGYTLVESGFVYGKGMAQDDLVLENVGTVQGDADGTVKLAKNSNTAGDGQFALTYGVTAKNATACARAYIIVKDAEGVATVYYADAQIFDYQA